MTPRPAAPQGWPLSILAEPLPTSLVIVSRHRPAELARCLRAVTLMDHPLAEVIVVADPASVALTAGMAVKAVVFDQANISTARNLGLAQAAGQVVAFVDDDAIPEPDWLRKIAAPFADPRVTAAGGVVRGRDGMRWQFRAGTVDASGLTSRFEAPMETHLYPPPGDGRAISTIGTNCAFRRDALAAIGGFASHHRYHLDETDVNLRLAAAGGWAAVVPDAQVLHGAAESIRRTAERVTVDLTEIGASAACFWRRHAPGQDHAPLADALIAAERRRLIAQMLAGTLQPGQVAMVLATLRAGLDQGRSRPLDPGQPIPAPPGFLRFPTRTDRPRRIIAGRRWNQARLRDQARQAAADGALVTLFLFSRTSLPHRLRFDPEGFWEQAGGLWGLSHPGLARPWRAGFATRLARETATMAAARRPEAAKG
ncbi:glycosyltransferase family 2 protein [Paracoccus sp. p3-h83]|uniref:glycosyltransferase family 2 protein n=1 Tax=Paracoccus sp. p3-h83 TaxID=3342805 RepID=UPI0035B7C9ED